MHNNRYPYSFYAPGIILGCLILLFTAALLSTELGRLYSGSNNRGRTDSNATFQYLMFPDRVVGYNGDIINPKPENRWIWPWSTATLLFSLIFFVTGVMGIISGQRESYSSILTFFICSLVSICLMIFLIATYATIIAGWQSIYEGSIPYFPNIDRKFAIACLALSCALLIILLISLILAGKYINIGTPKVLSSTTGGYEPLLQIPTPQLLPRIPQMTPRTPHFNHFS